MQTMRNAIIDANKDKFGLKYIALPNPSYGDWEPAQYNDGDGNYWALTPKQKREARKKALRTWVAPVEKKRMKAKSTEQVVEHKGTSLIEQAQAEEAEIEKAHGLLPGAIANDIHN